MTTEMKKQNQDFYSLQLAQLFALFSAAKAQGLAETEESVQRQIAYWMQNLMSESSISRDFKLSMLKKANEAGTSVPEWLHP